MALANHLEVSVVGLRMSGNLLFGLVVENHVEEEDENSLERIEDREDHCQPFAAFGKVSKTENPSQSQNAKQR